VACRVGSATAHTRLTSARARGGVDAAARGRIAELALAMRRTSMCGLGKVALGPVLSVLRLPAGPPPVEHPR